MTQPFHLHHPDRTSNVVFVCDHASNRVPECVNGGDLGLPPADMNRHIAYDIGAAGLTKALADHMNAPAVLSNFSRLVIDPNRGEDDPTLLMRLYDGTLIPANRHADDAEKERRVAAFHRPYHRAIDTLLANRSNPILISVHSFTKQLQNREPRPWHIGVLYADDDRLSQHLLTHLSGHPDLCIGENQPYTGRLGGDTMDQHALRYGHHHTLIELRNDLIETGTQQTQWADRLAPILSAALNDL